LARDPSKHLSENTLRNNVYDYDDKFIYVGLNAGVDSSTNAIETISYAHHEAHAGSHYQNEMFVAVPADDILDIRFVTPASTKWLHWIIEYNTEAEFEFTMYEVITITNAGTALTAINNNRNSTNTSGLTAFDYITNVNIAAANSDTGLGSAIILGQGHTGSGRSQAGSSFDRGAEIILKSGTGYCLRFDNESNAEKYVDWKMEWYEHTNK